MVSKAATIEAKGIGKDFGSFTALDDVSVHVPPGEFLTFLGPSGSGKTTFLMVLAGFEHATRGSLLLSGTELTDTPAENRGFGMVFQGYALFPHMTAAENIAFPLKVQKRATAEIKRRVGDMVDLVGLSGHEHKKPSGLSGGQQQRVALARALAYEPPVLLLDEPFSALDKNLRGQMQEELRRIHNNLGTTFIFVTHDQTEALALSTRVAIFDHGKLQQVASPSDVYERPANRFVAQFLGEINIFPARFNGQIALVENHSIVLPNGNSTGTGFLAVRPEHMSLELKADASRNCLPNRVIDLVYMGAQTRLLLKTRGGTNVSLDVPTTQLPDGMTPEQQVWVTWDARDSLVL